MKSPFLSRIFAVILAVTMLLALGATSAGAESADKPYDGVTVTMIMPEHPNQPMSADAPIIGWIKEYTGITLELDVVPSSDYNTKVSTLIATNSFPDIVRGGGGAGDAFRSFLGQDIFVDLLAYEHLIPNYLAMLEVMPEVKPTVYSVDGNLWGFPNVMYYENLTGPLPMIRGDILEETGLGMPQTTDELKAVLLKMKELYPDQYIWAGRGTPYHAAYALGSGWQWGSSNGVYFDHDRGMWVHGPTDDAWITYLEFMQELAAAGVTDPEYGSSAIWQEKMSSGKAFFAWDNAGIPINWEIALQEQDTDAHFEPIPTMTNAYGQQRGLFFNNNGAGINTVIRADSDENVKEAAIWLMDWLYSDEGRMLSNFGVEGETYHYVDGVPRFTDELLENAKTMTDPYNGTNGDYGLGSLALALYQDQRPQWPFMSETIMTWYDTWAEDPGMRTFVAIPVFTVEENEEIVDLNMVIQTMIASEMEDYLYGKKTIDEYKAFQEEMIDAGAKRLEELYNIAYERSLQN